MSMQWAIETHDSVQSTQTVLRGMADIGAPEGTVIHALEQTGGYGRHGREWVSAKGNLYLSILLRPSSDLEYLGQLSLMAGLAVGRTIENYISTSSALRLKWPNDVHVEGKKCAGLILETELNQNQGLKYILLGIGINLVSAPAEIGTAIKEHTDRAPKVNTLRTKLLNNVATYYKKWSTKGFEPIRREWLEYGHRPDDQITVKIGNAPLKAYFHDIDEYGALLIRDEQFRTQKITAGEVFS